MDTKYWILDLRSQANLNLNVIESVLERVKQDKYIGDIKWPINMQTNEKIDKLIQDVESQLMKNNDEYRPFPTDYVHGQMSLDVFNDTILEGDIKFFGNDEWKVLKVFNAPKEEKSFLKYKYRKKGCIYSGVLYYNKSRRQMVLAHRGLLFDLTSFTNENGALVSNWKGCLLNETIPQLVYCFTVTEQVSELAKAMKCHLSFTGYSNGAWLAENSLFFCERYFDNKTVKAVLFDGPGMCKDEKDLKSTIISNKADFFNLRDMNIVNYLTEPHLMNSSNLHVGLVYHLFINDKPKDVTEESFFEMLAQTFPIVGKKISNSIKKAKFIYSGFKSILSYRSRMESILSRFDPDTGQPIKKYTEEMLNWPFYNIQFDKNFENNLSKIITRPFEEIVDLVPFIDEFFKLEKKIIHYAIEKCTKLITYHLMQKHLPGLTLIINAIIEIYSNDNIDVDFFNNPDFYIRHFDDEGEDDDDDDDGYEELSRRLAELKKYHPPKISFISNLKSKLRFLSKTSRLSLNEINSVNDFDLDDLFASDNSLIHLADSECETKSADHLLRRLSVSINNPDNKLYIKGKFSLFIDSKFCPTEFKDLLDDLRINSDDLNLDWCLLKLSQTKLVPNKPSKIVFEQLKNLKDYYQVKTDTVNDFQLKTKHQIIIIREKDKSNLKLTVNVIRERMYRFIMMYPEIKAIFNQQIAAHNSFASIVDIPKKQRNFISKLDYKKMDQMIENGNHILIYGFSGIGKTTSACQYGHYLKESKGFVVRLFLMDSLSNISSNYIQRLMQELCNEYIYDLVDISKKNALQANICKINQKLLELTNFLNVLFIFDNVEKENFEIIEMILTNLPSNITVLVTSKSNNQELSTFFEKSNIIELSLFNREEARAMLQMSLNEHGVEDEEIKMILDSFHNESFIPLKIEIIISCIKANKLKTIANLIDSIKQEAFEKIFERLFQQIVNENGIVNLIFIYLAFMEPDNINTELISKLASDVIKKGEFKETLISNKKNLDVLIEEAIDNLIKLSILKLRKDDATKLIFLNIHRELQQELREYVTRNGNPMLNILENIYLSLLESFLEVLSNPKAARCDEKQISKLFKEFQSLNLNSKKTDQIIRLEAYCCEYIGMYYQNLYDDSNAIRLLLLSFNYYEAHKDEKRERKASILDRLGESFFRIGQYNHAFNAHIYAFDLLYDCKETQIIKKNLYLSLRGFNYNDLYQSEKLSFIENELKKQIEYIFEEKKMDSLSILILSQLAMAYITEGQYLKAIKYLQRGLDACKDEDCSDIAILYNKMGVSYSELEQYDKARDYFLKGYNIQIKLKDTQSYKDLKYATTLYNIGNYFVCVKDLNAAKEILNEAWSIYSYLDYRKYDFIGREAKECCYLLGELYFLGKEPRSSIQFFEEFMAIGSLKEQKRNNLIEKELEGKVCYYLGDLYRNLSDLKKSLDHLNKAAMIFEEIYNKRKLSSSKKDNNYFSLYLYYGEYYKQVIDFERAIEHYEKAKIVLENKERKSDRDHSNLASIAIRKSVCYYLNQPKDLAKAKKCLDESSNLIKMISKPNQKLINYWHFAEKNLQRFSNTEIAN